MTNTSYIDSIADKERAIYGSQTIPDRFVEVYKTTTYTGYLGLIYDNQGVRLMYRISHVNSDYSQINLATVAVQRHKNKVKAIMGSVDPTVLNNPYKPSLGLFNNGNFRYIPTAIYDPGILGFIETLLYFEVNPLEFITSQFDLDRYLVSTKENINRPLNKGIPHQKKTRVILELKPKLIHPKIQLNTLIRVAYFIGYVAYLKKIKPPKAKILDQPKTKVTGRIHVRQKDVRSRSL